MPGPLTPSETKRLLEQLGHHPVKKLGQNFLVDGNIVRKSIELAGIEPGMHVVEVGPGLGTLTHALVDAGAHVHAVEFDPRLAAHLAQLRENGNLPPGQFDLLRADAVDHPLGPLPAAIAESERFRIVANLPYAITTPWIDGILEGPLPERMVLMMQKEAADRLTAQPGDGRFGAISIALHAAFIPAAHHRVSRQCFSPVPGVDSILLRLDRRPQPRRLKPITRAAIRDLFTQRRKQIGSLVRSRPALQPWLDHACSAHGLDPRTRPEDIPLALWFALDERIPDASH